MKVTVLSEIYKLFEWIFSPSLHNRINFQAKSEGDTPENTNLNCYCITTANIYVTISMLFMRYIRPPQTGYESRGSKIFLCVYEWNFIDRIFQCLRAVWDDKMAVTCEPCLVCTDKMATVVRGSIFTSRDAIIEQSIIFIYTADRNRYKINRQSGGKILCLLQCCAKQSWLAAVS